MFNSSLSLLDGSLRSLQLPAVGLNPKAGQLAVNGQSIVLNDGSSWASVVDAGGPLYAFSTFTFTGPGSETTGPTLAQCNSAYAGAPFLGDTELFNVENGNQLWTVPETGTYRIDLIGASDSMYSYPAKVSVDCILSKSEVLALMVGRMGSSSGHGCSLIRKRQGDLIAISGGAAYCYFYNSTPILRHVALKFDTAQPAHGSNISFNGLGANGGAGYVEIAPVGVAASGYMTIPPAGLASSSGGPGGWGVSYYSGNGYFLLQSGGFGGGGGGGDRVESTVYRAIGGSGGWRGGNAASASFTNGAPGQSAIGNPGTCYANDSVILSKSISRISTTGNGSITITKLL